jgi:hypothetical protein
LKLQYDEPLSNFALNFNLRRYSLALLHPDRSSEVAQQAAAQRLKLFPGSEENDPPLPTVLAGSYDSCVYAYSADYGRVLVGAGK